MKGDPCPQSRPSFSTSRLRCRSRSSTTSNQSRVVKAYRSLKCSHQCLSMRVRNASKHRSTTPPPPDSWIFLHFHASSKMEARPPSTPALHSPPRTPPLNAAASACPRCPGGPPPSGFAVRRVPPGPPRRPARRPLFAVVVSCSTGAACSPLACPALLAPRLSRPRCHPAIFFSPSTAPTPLLPLPRPPCTPPLPPPPREFVSSAQPPRHNAGGAREGESRSRLASMPDRGQGIGVDARGARRTGHARGNPAAPGRGGCPPPLPHPSPTRLPGGLPPANAYFRHCLAREYPG
jgi:hypothetical protein